MENYKIGVLVGSLRAESFNLKAAKAMISLAPDTLKLELVSIAELPLYNEDIDGANPPEQYTSFREKIKGFDGFLFFTPEYNRSVPAALKNAVDVGSRPYGQNAWDGKPAGVVSVSISSLGGFGANHHLRQSLVFVNMPAMQQPEAYLANAQSLFDEQGNLNNDDTREFLRSYMQAYEQWVKKHADK